MNPGLPRSGVNKRADIIGVSVSDTTKETTIDTATGTADSRNSRSTIPPIRKSEMNTAISDMDIETMVKPILSAPLIAASIGVAVLDKARDVLDHHDRIIDEEADGDGQRHQREIVEAVAEHVHHREGVNQ
jgi:hypothetical protein